MEALRNDQLQRIAHHLVRLPGRYAGLKGQEVLALDPESLGKHLPPSVLQGGFDAQHGQSGGVERRIGIFDCAGEQEVGLRIRA
ncbi:MAG: hypothetical protein Q4G49_01910 [Paracoccus sp. (in: a-proteobacteria)]|nr:hypothetical protein [Paracoccus sp. (in: a-proteobacteria)]